MLFLQYPKCTTCKKAKSFLDSRNAEYEDRNIVDCNPTAEELKHWHEASGLDIKKFFNTCGMLYKSMNLKDKLPEMSLEEKYQLLASNGMLVKRPILIKDNRVLVGFKEAEWAEVIG